MLPQARVGCGDHRRLGHAIDPEQQFLDLLCYLMEIAEHGPARARALRPDPALLAPALPAYERNLDHAGMAHERDHRVLEPGEPQLTVE